MTASLSAPALEDIVSAAAEASQQFVQIASPNQLFQLNRLGLLQPLLLHRPEGHRITRGEASDLLSLAKTRGLW